MLRAPAFWLPGRRGLAPLLLSPVSAIYARATARRVARPGWRAPVPVICCGNVTAGGAGKTTVALDLICRLSARGLTPHALIRGYGGTAKGPLRVEPDRHDSRAVGDEALLLAKHAPTWVGADRAASARCAVAAGADAIVMDDGLQNPTLEKSLSLLVIDGSFGFGNGRVIPAGPLREPVAAAAARAHAAVLIGEDETGARSLLPAHLPVLRARLVPGPDTAALARRPVFAFAGIANPSKFFDTLSEAGAIMVGRRTFADHYPYDDADIEAVLAEAEALAALPVTTRKDIVRIPARFHDRIAVSRVGLAWDDLEALEALLAPLFPPKPAPREIAPPDPAACTA
ncbi:tetraacyldisaccharide 4'-kinase [Elioraea tepida]|uniref:Tetraacyldisaccharide 4'-kinase n=1 Tax=Elioraea tepida TaxID=2843330 RepID=A0A975U150_9PROT|nr:tetraacyldisaccharide 4'-kinase [Elioraea tepida]QXM23764.1 tetraacyldisaccharide 4'-kinase [Elioraea tepida]